MTHLDATRRWTHQDASLPSEALTVCRRESVACNGIPRGSISRTVPFGERYGVLVSQFVRWCRHLTSLNPIAPRSDFLIATGSAYVRRARRQPCGGAIVKQVSTSRGLLMSAWTPWSGIYRDCATRTCSQGQGRSAVRNPCRVQRAVAVGLLDEILLVVVRRCSGRRSSSIWR